MALTSLQIKAILQNVHIIYCPREYQWCFDIEDPLTGEKDKAYFKGTDCKLLPDETSIDKCVNFIMRWKQSKNIASIKLHHKSPMHYEHKNGKWCDFAFFKCVGLKITNFSIITNFHVMDVEGVIYSGVVGVQPNWVEKNPNLEEDVTISDLEFRVKTVP